MVAEEVRRYIKENFPSAFGNEVLMEALYNNRVLHKDDDGPQEIRPMALTKVEKLKDGEFCQIKFVKARLVSERDYNACGKCGKKSCEHENEKDTYTRALYKIAKFYGGDDTGIVYVTAFMRQDKWKEEISLWRDNDFFLLRGRARHSDFISGFEFNVSAMKILTMEQSIVIDKLDTYFDIHPPTEKPNAKEFEAYCEKNNVKLETISDIAPYMSFRRDGEFYYW